jgi:very-short-patch-repair endonuclease
MRHEATEPELWLWQHLRGSRLGGFNFRRQHPVGPFILDFYCVRARLAVEVDGSGHIDDAGKDEARTRWLGERGIRVIRFWNHEVSGQPEATLQAILEALTVGGDRSREDEGV